MRSLRETLCGQALKSFCLLGLCWAVASCSPSSSRSSGVAGNSATGSIRINELMARNTAVAITDDGDPPMRIVQDWVELYNAGDATISLARFGLTDNRDRPGKFRFPAGVRLEPRGFVVVYIVDPDACERRCDTVDQCVADELEECEEDFVECEQACLLRDDCLADPLTLDEDAACERQFNDCPVGVDTCESLRSDCLEQAMSPQTEDNCGERRARCLDNCNPIGFVADFALGLNETVYLFDGDRMIDRVGVTKPDVIDPDVIDPVTMEEIEAIEQIEEAEERFFDVSVGRYPDGTGPFGVHYAGATPGEPNQPTDVSEPSVSVVELADRTLPCGQSVDVSQFSLIMDTEQWDSTEVFLEYTDEWNGVWIPAGEGEPLDDEEALREDLPPESRFDFDGVLETVERSMRFYKGSILAGDCDVQRHVRVRVDFGDGGVFREGAGWTTFDNAPERLPTIAINEYMPRNTGTLRFQYKPRALVEGDDLSAKPIYERPDWIELVNYGGAAMRLMDENGKTTFRIN